MSIVHLSIVEVDLVMMRSYDAFEGFDEEEKEAAFITNRTFQAAVPICYVS